ncbi:MAG: FAD-binding oxidoreductase [Bacteroidales bacterium]|nr:FAD-binding oxidoreductase [Bacteroidales bacterium]
MTEAHKQFISLITGFIPRERIYTDELRRLAWGTDAGFYRLIPQVVVRARNEQEVSRLLQAAKQAGVSVTFRAAGTSLSGQAISDSVLIVAGKSWENYEIGPDALTITLEPGIIGTRVNEILAPLGRMFAPDPASKASAMVGGIVMNNASGMNCGTHANSDKVLRSIRIVLADGTILDTGDEASREEFRKTHPDFIREIEAIRDEIRADKDLSERIRYKYSIKNVTGLNLRPFIAYDDPFDIIAHCMVGSEGTLAFMSRGTFNTSHVHSHVATAMLYFSDLKEACKAVVALKKGPVFSAELLDKKSLSAVNDTTGEGLTAVLTETKADSQEELDKNIETILSILKPFKLFKPTEYTSDPAIYGPYWQIRAGIFPSVGGTRELGTTVLIEDVAFHIEDLPEATMDLQNLLVDNGYTDACIYGHALEGNYHFIIAQRFDSPEEVERYKRLMLAVERLVVDKYDGSLKAEHGTGRNMAPFVAKEWGEKAHLMMWRLKKVFDPDGMLNPGVIFNDDPECFIKGMKPMPMANEHVDRCIECGFCEVNCVSCGLTLSARQRIVATREITRLRQSGAQPERLKEIERDFDFYGVESCAGDGLCSTSCPMGINTGELVHDLRRERMSKLGKGIGRFAANNLRAVKGGLRPILTVAGFASSVMGPGATTSIGKGLNKIGIPLWTPSLPGASKAPKLKTMPPTGRKVVYFPSCINQTMGASKEPDGKPENLMKVMVRLCEKAGFEVVFPRGMQNLCCGMIWESKGMPDIADAKTAELEKALREASEDGKWPILCDQSPCLHRMREHIKGLKLHEPAEFIADYLLPHLKITPIDEKIAVHVTCSTRRMGVANKLIEVANKCTTGGVLVPAEVGCCGFAGDKGFTLPELNRWGLRKLRPQIEAADIKHGYSNSRTCEIGLTTNSGIPYKSIAYLVDQVTTKSPL